MMSKPTHPASSSVFSYIINNNQYADNHCDTLIVDLHNAKGFLANMETGGIMESGKPFLLGITNPLRQTCFGHVHFITNDLCFQWKDSTGASFTINCYPSTIHRGLPKWHTRQIARQRKFLASPLEIAYENMRVSIRSCQLWALEACSRITRGNIVSVTQSLSRSPNLDYDRDYRLLSYARRMLTVQRQAVAHLASKFDCFS